MNGRNTMFAFFDYAVIVSTLLAFEPVSSTEIPFIPTSHYVVDDNHSIMFAREGNNATFQCPKIFPDDHVQLFIDGDYEITLSERVSFHPNVGFKIAQLTNDDTGLYRCTLKRDFLTRTMRWYDVIVQRMSRRVDTAEIDEYRLRHLTEGQDLKVNCSARISTADITAIGWRSSGGRRHQVKTRLYRLTELYYTVIGEELTIMNVSSEDTTTLSCCLQRGVGVVSMKTTSLIVQKPPTHQNEADMKVETISIQNGTTATFVCPKESHEHEIRLFIDDNYEVNPSDKKSNDSTSVFEIKNFVVDDTGVYKCKVVEGKKNRTVENFYVGVNRGPRELRQPEIDGFRLRHIVEGQTLRVNCSMEVDKFEYAIPYWSTPSKIDEDRMSVVEYTEHTSNRTIISLELTLPNISFQDAGTYRCNDGFGLTAPRTAEAVLTVHDKPRINKP